MTTFALYQANGRIETFIRGEESQAAQHAAALGLAMVPCPDDATATTHLVRNGAAVPFPVAPSEHHVWDWGTGGYVDSRPLAVAKEHAWDRIKKVREARIASAGVTSLATFDTAAAQARADITSVAVLLMANPGMATVNFTCADDVRRTFARADFLAAASLIGARVQDAYDTADELRQAIDAAPAVAAVEAVTWPT